MRGDVARSNNPPRLCIQKLIAVPPMIVPELKEIAHPGSGNPSSAVAVHGDRQTGERVAGTTAGGSRRK